MITTLLTEKDAVTEQLRQMILSAPVGICETSRAEASLSALSLQSLTYPNRHAWVEVDTEGTSIDLEDFRLDDEWDNAVARTDADSLAEAADILRVWLSGADLEAHYSNINKEYEPLVKKY